MKRCPRCSIRYSQMWNICMVCSSPLVSDTIVSKIFTKNRQSAGYLFPIIEKSIEQANALLLYLDIDLKLIMCNKAVEQITGYSRKEIFKGDWQKFFFGKNQSKREIFKAVLLSSFVSVHGYVYEGSVMRKDGTERALSWSNTVITDVAGKPRGIFCIATDVTEYKFARNDVAACSESFKDIFVSIKDYALITTNLANKITYYGASATSLFNWNADMILKDISILFMSDNEASLISKIKRNITSKGSFEEELTLLRSDGKDFPAMLLVSALISAENKASGYLYIIRDVTETKKMAAQMIQSEKMAAMGQLAAGVAHEINNPLLVILGRIDMLAMDGEESAPTIKKTLSIIEAQAKHMRVIVDRLLLYSRNKPVSKNVVEINDVLKTISPLVAYYSEFHKIIWKEDLHKGPAKIKGDFNQLQEVFLNLAINACQTMSDGGTLTISSFKPDDEFIHVRFEDTGSGIKREDMGKLFLPFFTTKDTGTGLGLPLCYSIVESHGGRIEVESEVDKGAVFTVKLPAYKLKESYQDQK